MAWQEYMNPLKENLEADVKNQSWGGWAIDQAKEFASPYWQLKQRGFADVSRFYGGVGTNISEQAKAYDRIPFEERKTRLKADLDKFKSDNPSLALSWLTALMGQSSGEEAWNNLIGIGDMIP